eukprot:SAG11_NODE_700_length_7673_cov_7.359255_3_plen_95_part_00
MAKWGVFATATLGRTFAQGHWEAVCTCLNNGSSISSFVELDDGSGSASTAGSDATDRPWMTNYANAPMKLWLGAAAGTVAHALSSTAHPRQCWG